MAATAAAAAVVVVVVMEVAAAAVSHVAAAAAGGGRAAGILLALVSGRQDRCKAPGPSSKPRPGGSWTSTCSRGNNHSD